MNTSKLLFAIILLVFGISVPAAHAQNASFGSEEYCRNLTVIRTQLEWSQCCDPGPGSTSWAVCNAWTDRGTPVTVPGTVNSGTVNTNSPFATQPTIEGNPSVSPQTGSAGLAECSAIKFKSLLDILIWVKCIITAVIIPLIFALATLFFLWNVLRFIQSSEKTNKEEAKQRMWWGIIALFVMLGVWGIIRIMSNTLGLDPTVPLLQTDYLDPKKPGK